MAPASADTGGKSFSELPLSPAMLANLTQLEYLTMTPIQAASLPIALAGHSAFEPNIVAELVQATDRFAL
jgi:ATP-independent RNA helicase DbpA